MHREFKRLLRHAHGESEFVLALNIDIRGFSEFSMTVDSSETAMYVKRVYAEIIDRYFPRAEYFKPTGDGLLLIVGFTERTLAKRVEETVDACMRLVSDFPRLTQNDPMINFEVPPGLGIGASRGAACRLVSGTSTLDYSGRVLNLASRLMGHARPSGLVFDSAFGPELLPRDVLREFDSETIYLKGIAEDVPVTVFYSAGVEIDEYAKRPLSRVEWESKDRVFTLRHMKEPHGTPIWDLNDPPLLAPAQIQVKILATPPGKSYPLEWDYKNFKHEFTAGKDIVRVDLHPMPALLGKWGIRLNATPITVRVLYPRRP